MAAIRRQAPLVSFHSGMFGRTEVPIAICICQPRDNRSNEVHSDHVRNTMYLAIKIWLTAHQLEFSAQQKEKCPSRYAPYQIDSRRTVVQRS